MAKQYGAFLNNLRMNRYFSNLKNRFKLIFFQSIIRVKKDTMMMRYLVSACLLMATVSAEELSNKQLRSNFIKAMDEAVQVQKTRQDLLQRLFERAQPVPFPRQLANDDSLDLTQFALKYVGCSSINTWSDDVAQDADAGSVFSMERFVIFRLCPSEYCGSYGRYGCDSGYGEYMVQMEDYLNIMADYHYDRFQTYCETCTDCMEADAVAYGNDADAYGDDGAGDDGAYGDDNNRRRLADDDGYADGDDAGDDAGDNAEYQCQYSKACKNYKSACQYYEDLQADEHEEFFECTAVQNNDDVVYLGPHCNSDGSTISIGVYADAYCTQYIGEKVDVEDYTGMDFTGFSDFFSSSSCVSCLSKVRGRLGKEICFFVFVVNLFAFVCNMPMVSIVL